MPETTAEVNRSISRDATFHALRASMRRFAEFHKLADLEQVASEMEMWGDASWDPAIKDAYDRLMPEDTYTLADSLRLAARFMESEYVDDYPVRGAKGFAKELLRAAQDATYRPEIMKPYFTAYESSTDSHEIT